MIMTSKSEIWKSHPDIAGIKVSSFGRVRTLDKVVPCGKHTQFVKGRVLKPHDNGTGYLQVNVKVAGKWTKKYVHRLVAQAFISNPDSLPEVNHKDNDRTNNHVNNLEFCTRSYNMKYKEKFGISNTEILGHPVFAINLSTLEVSHFHSQKEVSRELRVFNSNVNKVIKGRLKQTGGFWFTNADENADDAINRKLHEIGKTGLKIK